MLTTLGIEPMTLEQPMTNCNTSHCIANYAIWATVNGLITNTAYLFRAFIKMLMGLVVIVLL